MDTQFVDVIIRDHMDKLTKLAQICHLEQILIDELQNSNRVIPMSIRVVSLKKFILKKIFLRKDVFVSEHVQIDSAFHQKKKIKCSPGQGDLGYF